MSRPQSTLSNLSSSQSTLIARQSPTPGLRYPSNRKTIYDRNLNRSRNAELSRAAFAYLFVEMIGYAQRQKGVGGVADLERRLNTQGYPLGLKLLDLLLSRSSPPSQPPSTRPTRILHLLQFIQGPLWRHLFGRPADALERSAERKEEYMITDNDVLVNEFVSVPREISSLNVAAFVAGIVEGVCDGAGFATRGVSAHWASESGADGEGSGAGGGMWPGKTVFLVRFSEVVVEREEILARGGS